MHTLLRSIYLVSVVVIFQALLCVAYLRTSNVLESS